MMRSLSWCVLLVAVLFGACGGEDPAALPGVETSDGESREISAAYQVVLANAISDTLSGNASFGRVRDPQNDRRRFVIRLRSSFDFAGGVVISRRSNDPPEEGTYELSADSVKLASPDQFVIIYREGMLRDLRSVSGSLSFSAVTDSLIEGEFDATLRGYISEGSRDIESGEVHAVGRFRAEPGMSGYVIGL